MSTIPTMRAWIDRAADRAPKADALRSVDGHLDYEGLRQRAMGLAAELTALGTRDGDFIILATGAGYEFPIALAAIVYAGCLPVVVDPNDRLRLLEIVNALAPAACVSVGSLVAGEVFGCPLVCCHWDSDALAVSVSAAPRPEAATPTDSSRPMTELGDAAFVLSTSGSTAQAKLIVWSQERLRAFGEGGAPGSGLALHSGDCLGLLVPPHYAMGFLTIMRAWQRGLPLGLISRPESVSTCISEIAALGVSFVAATATHATLWLEANLDLPAPLRIVRFGGGPIDADTLVRFADRFPVAVARTYGLAEVGSVTMLLPADVRGAPSTSGRPMPGNGVEIRDESGGTAALGEEGEIWVRLATHAACDGYLLATDEQRNRFSNGLLRTGDRGSLSRDGYLTVLTRVQELLKVAGKSVSAPHVEATLAQAPGAPALITVGEPHPLYEEVPVVVYEASLTLDIEAVLDRHARRSLRKVEVPRRYLPRRTLPRTPSGKLRRGMISAEVARWAAVFDGNVAFDGRLWPARSVGEHGSQDSSAVWLVDGVPAEVIAAMPAVVSQATVPGARRLSVCREHVGEIECLGIVVFVAGPSVEHDDVRVITGPHALDGTPIKLTADLELDALLSAILVAALSLPGAHARMCIAVGHDASLAARWRSLGFTQIDAEVSAAAVERASLGKLDMVGRVELVEWRLTPTAGSEVSPALMVSAGFRSA